MKILQKERQSITYQPLSLADMTVRVIVGNDALLYWLCQFRFERALNSADAHHSHITYQPSGSLMSQSTFR
jgi:hypothetical protein